MSAFYPSLFNDVLGPAMVGPSSSHTAACVRIGGLLRQLLTPPPNRAVFWLSTQGALAASYHGHGSDIGLAAGLMGMSTWDARIPQALSLAKSQGLDISFQIDDAPVSHPNLYRVRLSNSARTVEAEAVSIGGGAVRLTRVDCLPVEADGGAWEQLFVLPCLPDERTREGVQALCDDKSRLCWREGEGGAVLQWTGEAPCPPSLCEALSRLSGAKGQISLTPVLPVPNPPRAAAPFGSEAELLAYCGGRSRKLADLAALYESERSGIAQDTVWERAEELVVFLENSLDKGLAGTSYADRLLPCQTPGYLRALQEGRLIPGDVMNGVVASVSALMEVKSAMGPILAAPTAGACGAMPGAVLGAGRALNLSRRVMAGGLLAAGLVGAFICRASTFAAEVCGCQAECGAGSAMAAAALAQMMGSNAVPALDAAAMALQNVLGLVCDPVAERVDVPCLGKNVMAAMNALACVNMALAGFERVIPLDETIDAMDRVGRALPAQLRCTCAGGLSVCPTSKRLLEKLK